MPIYYPIFYRRFTVWPTWFIIGQFEDISSITAVSIGSQVMHMITVMIVGLAMGATVNIGQAIGQAIRKSKPKISGIQSPFL